MIAYCGIVCTGCPAYLATQNDDDQLRAETATQWSQMFNTELDPEEINCYGCQSEGQKIIGYAAVCLVRKCGREKGIENCAFCDDYTCAELAKIHDLNSEARRVLEEIRAGQQG